MSGLMIEKIGYRGWPNCYRLSNKIVDIVVTADVGPRIIRFGFVEQGNMFKEYPEMLGKTGGDEWRIYGGHRFWHAPEDLRRTYFPDNAPVEVYEMASGLSVVQPPEKTTGIQKEIDVMLSPDRAHLKVVHRLRNTNVWPVELAPWALSVMTPGGTAIIPLPPRIPHDQSLLPTATIAVWSYTDLSDPRWTWGRRYILLRQDTNATSPQKIGLGCEEGWVVYTHPNGLFLKRFVHEPGKIYSDLGASVETFTNPTMLEIETLGPLQRIEPDGTAEHVEQWFLLPPVAQPQNDADVDRDIIPAIADCN